MFVDSLAVRFGGYGYRREGLIQEMRKEGEAGNERKVEKRE